jgi:translation initiation factor 5A
MSKNIEDFIQTHVQASSVKVGHYVIIHSVPCKIVSISFAKTGKHGHAKAMMTGIDILTDKKHDYTCTSATSLQVPIVKKHEWCLINVDHDTDELFFLDDKNDEHVLSFPKDNNSNESDLNVKESILKYFSENDNDGSVMVTILECFGQYRFIGCKLSK